MEGGRKLPSDGFPGLSPTFWTFLNAIEAAECFVEVVYESWRISATGNGRERSCLDLGG